MSTFLQTLRDTAPNTHHDDSHLDSGDAARRDWLFVPYDQLSDQIGPLADRAPDELGIVLVESAWKADRRPYHLQKLAFILANQRHFALEQAERGVAVRYLFSDEPYAPTLRRVLPELGPLTLMRPAERELRADLAPLVDDGSLEIIPHDGWLTSPRQFVESQASDSSDHVDVDQMPDPPWRMDAFYRRVRRDTGLLMQDGSPAGGQFSHDGDNREFWPGEPPAPTPPQFDVDDVTAEVGDMLEARFSDHPGQLDLAALPTSRQDARRAWQWALDECMTHFGPYEDAMSRQSRTIFHTRISPLLNVYRLLPERVVHDAASADAPINSREGFIRQVIGWREFMRHVHEQTDGFRRLPDDIDQRAHPESTGDDSPLLDEPDDGGWSRWRDQDWPTSDTPDRIDGGATPRALPEDPPIDVPPAFWGETSGLACLDEVVDTVMDQAWSHHIPRLMVLANIATLLGVEPRSLTDWFWSAYIDAFDWVVEPNVLGMGTFALGDLFTTKPYVSGANYIDGMSDYCADCQFDPSENCPLTNMYWHFLDRHADELDGNRRLGLMLAQMRKRSDDQRTRDRQVFEQTRRLLADGTTLTPENTTPPDDTT